MSYEAELPQFHERGNQPGPEARKLPSARYSASA